MMLYVYVFYSFKNDYKDHEMIRGGLVVTNYDDHDDDEIFFWPR